MLSQTKKWKQMPEHVRKVITSMSSFDVLPVEEQNEYINIAIAYIDECQYMDGGLYMEDYREPLKRLLDKKIELAFAPKRAWIYSKEKNEKARKLMEEIDYDFHACAFITPLDLAESNSHPTGSTKYGGGLARYISVALAKEQAKAKLFRMDKLEKYIVETRERVLKKYKEKGHLKETFDHDIRQMQKVLDEVQDIFSQGWAARRGLRNQDSKNTEQ